MQFHEKKLIYLISQKIYIHYNLRKGVNCEVWNHTTIVVYIQSRRPLPASYSEQQEEKEADGRKLIFLKQRKQQPSIVVAKGSFPSFALSLSSQKVKIVRRSHFTPHQGASGCCCYIVKQKLPVSRKVMCAIFRIRSRKGRQLYDNCGVVPYFTVHSLSQIIMNIFFIGYFNPWIFQFIKIKN